MAANARSMLARSLSNMPGRMCGRGDDGVEAGLMKAAEHREALVGRARAVVDRGDPVAVQVDEPSHSQGP